MKRIIVLLAVMLLFVGCSSKEAALDPLGSSYISGQWVAYNEPDVLNQPSDLYLSFAEDGSMYYWAPRNTDMYLHSLKECIIMPQRKTLPIRRSYP